MKTTRLIKVLLSVVVCVATAETLRAAQLNLNFSSLGTGGILDKDGQSTGLTTRLTGTGGSLAANDAQLDIDTAAGVLNVTTPTTNQDFNAAGTGIGLDTVDAIGVNLSSLGYTGTQDFSVTTTIQPFLHNGTANAIANNDQAGVFVGQNAAALTRAGHITFANAPEYFSTNTQGNADVNGHFFGFGLNVDDGLTVTISRTGGVWQYLVDGVPWAPNSAGNGTGTFTPPTYLNGLTDLTVGIFAINTNNTTPVTYKFDSVNITVPIPGDATGNGVVDLNDFNLISDNLFKTVTAGLNGDVTLDGVVNYADFRLWKNNYHPGAGAGGVGGVPEPSAIALAVIALLGVFAGKRFVSQKHDS